MPPRLPSPLLYLRSLIFWLVMFTSTLVLAPLTLLTFPFPFRLRYTVATQWARLNLWWLRISCGLHYRVEGREHIPAQASIVFSKHQSTWETLALQRVFPPQVWVLKRELLRIPLFGWALALIEPIAIDRGAGRRAVEQLVEQGTRRLADGRWVIVFPEGTRTAPGKKGKYRIGGAVLAERSGATVVPVAHNAGEFWPRHSFIKYPGEIRMVVGPPIATDGRAAAEILAEAEAWIESTVDRISTLSGTND
ncbi:1-acyl-sn-glycerol-3-phosphate acyltransferase [Thiohalobacter sp. COW1]|uniref:Phospholipid/glycerol acyltransferase n=1 Tax=Thiohalobacter thiocyanaticus TaxID=585455 RepID=A0A1Z4VLV9_9GAMM|nr:MULTISPECIES: lysophospholipid acyltransferase family protein [Thiohalobacter]BAZ92596.1 phospholipid/glycerol acyltransferase [Thiohalobacter thiocyanaticus]BCO32427.1 1-acyl-sn-glycerol-3-phosphate acyltransferase [Thiohalobacter sp. COW1]